MSTKFDHNRGTIKNENVFKFRNSYIDRLWL